MKIEEEIERTKREMESVKPRSRRRTELELRLRDMRLQQLQSEATIGNAYQGYGGSVGYSISAWLASCFTGNLPRMTPAKPKSISAGTR